MSKRAAVVDSSFLLSLLLPDELPSKSAVSAYKDFIHQKIDWVAPEYLKVEVANALKSSFTQKRLSKITAQNIFDKFILLDISYSKKVNYSEFLMLSMKHNLSAYDSLYLSIVLDKKLPLLSLDRKLLDVYNEVK